MQETNAVEKHLQSWKPRRPSARIAQSLFERSTPAPVFLRRGELWRWLTPALACAMALLVVTENSGRRGTRLNVSDSATFFAQVEFPGAISNQARTVALSKLDANVEWNVWPHVWNVIQTNH